MASRRRLALVAVLVGLTATELSVAPGELSAASLRGSPASMVQQNSVARQHGLTFFRTPAEIRQGVERGALVKLRGNADYVVADFVRFPYLEPAAHLFVERLAYQYREACGQQLVVTSAVRPTSGQPANSHRLSVHPAGIAVDLRVSDRAACRSWLESALLGLERRGVINGIREFRPPHYHVAVYPEQYLAYVGERLAVEAAAAERLAAAATAMLPAGPLEVRHVAAASLLPRSERPLGDPDSMRTPLAVLLTLLLLAPLALRRRFLKRPARSRDA